MAEPSPANRKRAVELLGNEGPLYSGCPEDEACVATALDAAELRGMERAATICERRGREAVTRIEAMGWQDCAEAIRAAAKEGKP